MSYPDVVIACIEHKVFWKHSEQIEAQKHDNNMNIIPLVADWSP